MPLPPHPERQRVAWAVEPGGLQRPGQRQSTAAGAGGPRSCPRGEGTWPPLLGHRTLPSSPLCLLCQQGRRARQGPETAPSATAGLQRANKAPSWVRSGEHSCSAALIVGIPLLVHSHSSGHSSAAVVSIRLPNPLADPADCICHTDSIGACMRAESHPATKRLLPQAEASAALVTVLRGQGCAPFGLACRPAELAHLPQTRLPLAASSSAGPLCSRPEARPARAQSCGCAPCRSLAPPLCRRPWRACGQPPAASSDPPDSARPCQPCSSQPIPEDATGRTPWITGIPANPAAVRCCSPGAISRCPPLLDMLAARGMQLQERHLQMLGKDQPCMPPPANPATGSGFWP